MKDIFVIKMRLLILILCFLSFQLPAQSVKPSEVKEVMEKVADWQIFHINEPYSGRSEPHHPLFWGKAAFYTGLVKWAEIADSEKYYEWLKQVGETSDWKLHERIYHADDHAVGQAFVELYRKYGAEEMISPTIERFDYILYHPAKTALTWPSTYHHDRWSWCDALFMSPPVWAKVYLETGDKKYLDFMMSEYKATTDFLFDEDENLYYRDESYIGKRDNGTKIFWSRGNGWVFGGLTMIMDELEPDSEEYNYFLKIYKKMAAKLIKIQTPEGHWAMSLLGQEYYPTPEASGTSFFTFGLAWGINNGILDKKKYEPAVLNAWKALTSYVTEEGMLGYVQPIGAAPGSAWPDKTETYGSGAFLAAGAEVYKLYGGK